MDSRKLLAQATSAIETTWEDSIVNFEKFSYFYNLSITNFKKETSYNFRIKIQSYGRKK